ncbi:MAG: DnaJ domain-containing protein [Thermofilum sp.]
MKFIGKLLGLGASMLVGRGPLSTLAGVAMGHILDMILESGGDVQAMERHLQQHKEDLLFVAAASGAISSPACLLGLKDKEVVDRCIEKTAQFFGRRCAVLEHDPRLMKVVVQQVMDSFENDVFLQDCLQYLAISASYGEKLQILRASASLCSELGILNRKEVKDTLRKVVSGLGIHEDDVEMVLREFMDPVTYACYVLGVPRGAGEEEVRSAYHRLSLQYHPDRVASLAPEFQELAARKFREITEAYNLLVRYLKERR